MENLNIGVAEENRKAVTDLLTGLLANETVLYQRLRNYHWNVRGMYFKTLHELFEEQYTAIATNIDEVAERIRSLGATAIGTMDEMIKHAALKEKPGVYPEAKQMLSDLLEDHEHIIRSLRSGATASADQHNDEGTADMMIALMEAHEKMAWMIRTYLND